MDDYPYREHIKTRAFALRHMILEELKRRGLASSMRSPDGKSPNGNHLSELATRVKVEWVSGRSGYKVSYGINQVELVPPEAVVLYARGDRSPVNEADLSQLDQASSSDSVLSRNREFVATLVDRLIKGLYRSELLARELLSSSVVNAEEPTLPLYDGLSCVLPCYNELGNIEHAIRTLVQTLGAEVSKGKYIGAYEIIVVDDGSGDGSIELLKRLSVELEQLRLIEHRTNQGYGASLYSGFSAARFELIFFCDSDGQFDYSQLAELLPLSEYSDLVAGYREQRQDPLIRKLNALGWNILVRFCFGKLVRDIDCAFKLLRGSALRSINLLRIRGRGAIINTEILVRLKQLGCKFTELPVRHYPREQGSQSGAKLPVIARAFWELFKLVVIILAEKLGWFGFVTGSFSRTDHPLEVLRFRRSKTVDSDQPLNCPICGAGDSFLRETNLRTCEDLKALGEYRLFACVLCENGFVAPPPKKQHRNIQPDLPSEKFGYIEQALLNWFIRIRVERCLKSANKPGSLEVLDVGTGSGRFAKALVERGHRVSALEPNSPVSPNPIQSTPVNFIHGDFDESLISSGVLALESFDLITIWHVLEHLGSPHEALKLMWKLLRPGGCLYICVPNLNSLQADLGGNYWAFLDIPHHVMHFTLNGLVQTLRQCNFERFNIHWFSLEYDIFGFYQTTLNLLTRSHNFYYNRKKKGITLEALRYPRWTRLMTELGPLILPLATLLSLWGSASGKPACVELCCYKPADSRCSLKEPNGA